MIIDLAKDLGSYLKRPVKIENIAWDGLIPSLETGKVDAVISSMTITEDRKKTVDFSDPYAHSYLALLVNKNSSVSSSADLNKKGIVVDVKKGTTGNVYADKNLTNATVNALTSENACVTEVVQGKADAFIYDHLTALDDITLPLIYTLGCSKTDAISTAEKLLSRFSLFEEKDKYPPQLSGGQQQ